MKKSASQREKAYSSSDQWPEEQEAAFDEPPFAIFMSPTTDSLDGDKPYRPGPDATATATDITQPPPPPRARSVDGDEQWRHAGQRESTPTRVNNSSAGGRTLERPQRQRASSTPSSMGARPSVVQYPPPPQDSPLPPRPERSPVKKRKSSVRPKDFQHPEDDTKVTARVIDLSTRTAFEPIRPVSVEEWQSIANHASQVRKTSMEKKLSPSLQHLELLHKMNSVKSIRQLDFSPSVGLESDVFVPWDEDLLDDGSTTGKRRRRRRGRKSKRDGRYRSIDPFKAVADALPQHPPVLSNRKYRLPMRSDVGFPNASEEDIIKKQQEIAREAEWEEASPRLVVLVTSDDIGTAVDEPPPSIPLQHKEWNGGGLEGIPFAGKELMMAKERNVRLSKHSTREGGKRDFKYKPDRTNMLAPPLEATYSSTLGWRPRPFNDLPAGMVHGLVCPLNVQFDIGNIEPMVGSIALYCLPKDPGRKGAFGKMSEEFYFPVGMWKGHVSLEAARTLKGAVDHDMIEAWYGRKHKGLFPFDPISVPWEEASLYLVLQVYKVPHANASAPYLEPKGQKNTAGPRLQRSKSIGSRLKGSMGKRGKSKSEDFSEDVDVGVAQAQSSATFHTFRTQFLTPFCFGVSQLFPEKVVDAIAENSEEGLLSLDAANVNWPNGLTNEIQLFALPSRALSQEEFVRHVATIAKEGSGFQGRSQPPMEALVGRDPSVGDRSYTSDDNSENGKDTMSIESSSLPQSKMPSSSLSPSRGDSSLPSRKSFLKRSSSKSVSNKKRLGGFDSSHFGKIAGRATLFVSAVGNDFSQSMLHTPLELLDSSSERGVHALPRLLVDITGDCAIMMNPSASKVSAESSAQGFEALQRRSDLVRLPLSSIPSGYADAAEVRQMLLLPPRPEKRFDIDPPTSFRSCLNLLYMYPRLLRVAQDADVKEQQNVCGQGKQTKNELVSYSVRIQLVRSSVALDKSSGQMETSQVTLESFHNPAPWAGPHMLQAVYTKINDASKAKYVENDLYNGGVPLRDEIKMRLPTVIDGSYFLQFTLFSVAFNDDTDGGGTVYTGSGIAIESLAETTIPLSSSSNREPSSGVRVTTVIPNGCHRVRLGKYQLHLETRLVSSIHVSDPTLATVLRDFPFAKDQSDSNSGEKLGSLALVPSRSVVGKATEASTEGDIPFHQLLSTSPESTILGYFPVLVYMHLCNLVNPSNTSTSLAHVLNGDRLVEHSGESEATVKFAMENMYGLLKIFRRVKIELGAKARNCGSCKRSDTFLKNYVDNFDEASLLRWQDESDSANQLSDTISSDKSRSSSSLTRTPQKSTTPEDDAGEYSDDSGEEDNVSLIAVRRRNDQGPLKNASTFNSSAAPFSRVAFGASKTDRMRVEAELYHQSSHFTHLFDDDETVVTNLYSLATPREDSNVDAREREDFGSVQHHSFSLEREDSIISQRPSTKGAEASLGAGVTRGHGSNESGFVKRVRTAAQVMIAPCITPSLSAVLTGTGNSPKGADTEKEKQRARMVSALKSRMGPSVVEKLKSLRETRENDVHVLPGSDTEDESDAGNLDTTDEAILRDIDNICTLSCTIADSSLHKEDGLSAVPFVYEVMMALWLRSFIDHVENAQNDSGDSSGESFLSIERSFLFCSEPENAAESSLTTFELFHSQMDVLLPLCLKSFLLRCTTNASDSSLNGRVLLDRWHMNMLVPFVEMLTHGLVGEALARYDGDGHSDLALLKALSTTELVLDFLVGLASVLHPQQTALVLQKHFKIIRDCEIPDENDSFVWNNETLRRARSSRQLRLRSVERLSCMPNFVAINYPLKYVVDTHSPRPYGSTSWTSQSAQNEGVKDTSRSGVCPYRDGRDRLPQSGWLASLLAGECLSIASLSCEAIVAEAMAHVETASPSRSGSPSSTSDRPGASLSRNDILLLQSTSIHSISCVYELLLRRHSMDSRFQKEQARSRIAALFAPVILDKSLKSTRWLARMEATHKVRSTWLLCFMYIMQEAPESQLRAIIRSYCFPPDFLVQRFIRLLRLSSATFQSFIDQKQNSSSDSVLSVGLAPWLLQECFNTICAATNMLVDECAEPMSAFPVQERKMTQGILDLLLHILTAPQSAVTHLRTIGGALETLNKLGAENFLNGSGASLQHWIRIILTLMNSTSLSVRSMSVDFAVSLLSATFNLNGNVDEIGVVIATVLPEVVAREIGLYSVNGLIHSIEDVECAVWPLRRALADIEEANPLDDDRVDPFLSPLLSTLCRACQAIIDGVLIELRLTGSECVIVGSKLRVHDKDAYTFDADEESLYEAASFFVPESAPLQRLRWLFTLTRLHEAKGQWVEAAETNILCARTASDAIPHVKNVWRPSRFLLWYDKRRSLWLSTVGKEMGRPDIGHAEVMKFADVFLEPPTLVDEVPNARLSGMKLPQPSVQGMCSIISYASKQAVSNYMKEGGMEELASSRLEGLLQPLMLATDEHNEQGFNYRQKTSLAAGRRTAAEIAGLRRVSVGLNGELARLAESAMSESEEDSSMRTSPVRGLLSRSNSTIANNEPLRRQYYVRVVLTGKKPHRFMESTTIPTFLEWDNPCICRIPENVVESVVANGARDVKSVEERLCTEFGRALRNALLAGSESTSLMFRTGVQAEDSDESFDTSTTFLDVSIVHMDLSAANGSRRDNVPASRQSRHFFYRESGSVSVELPPTSAERASLDQSELIPDMITSNVVELTVAHAFPCALSRQRTLLKSDILAGNANDL